MTSTPVDTATTVRERRVTNVRRSQTRTAADGRGSESGETFSPARRVLPWALMLLALSLVATGYALVLAAPVLITGGSVLTAAALGAVGGLSVRDSRDRWVSAPRALGEGARRLGRALWH